MQSVNQQVNPPCDIDDADIANPVRPEPMVSDRIRRIGQAGHPHGDVRDQLADAFRSLGRGMHAKGAYRQAREFYRASGHEWTRGLK